MTRSALSALASSYCFARWKNPEGGEPIVEMPTNYIKFERLLCEQYEFLFANDPGYAYAAKRTTPAELAAKMTGGLRGGSASKDGKGIKAVCKALGIAYTYKAIAAYLKA